MKNRVAATFILTLLVALGLVAMYFLPPLSVGGEKLRKVDIMADLRPDYEEPLDSDSILLPAPVKPAFIDSCKEGMVCIEDYSDSTSRGMDHFYEVLGKIGSIDRPVRIAYFGDSFIEGDILTGALRDLLQDRFGGCGVGYVPITSQIAGFRTTVRHSFGGWDSHSITDSVYFNRSRQDLSNHYFIPGAGSYVTLGAAKGDSCHTSTIYFQAKDSVHLSAYINGSGTPVEFAIRGNNVLQSVTATGNIKRIRWRVGRLDSTSVFYASTMDPKKGVVLDNFSTRGCSGMQLRSVPMSILRGYQRMRTYDLIVLQYGLNVASDKVSDYTYYKNSMVAVIEHLKEAFPEASILVVSVGDRDEKTETGELKTMRGVKNLIRYQQAIAAESNVAFWNLFEAMGGEGSMAELVHSKPSMANYDYTHINPRGGDHLAKIMFDVLVYGKEQYEKRKAYEAE